MRRFLVLLLFVVAPAAAQSPPPFRVDAAFDVVWAYPGQAVSYTVTAYSDTERDVEFNLPTFEGFWQTGGRGFSGSATIDGKQYNTSIYQVTLYPHRIGRLEVPGAKVDFAETVFSEGASRLSASASIDVLELPAAPDGFSGLVGAVGAQFTAEPAVVLIGEPIQVTLRLQGAANLAQFPPVDLEVPDGWRLYHAPQLTESVFDGNALTQTRVIRWRAIADRAGRASLSVPPITYFTTANGYNTLEIPPLDLEALPGPNGELSREEITRVAPSLLKAVGPLAAAGAVPNLVWGVAPILAIAVFTWREAIRRWRQFQIAARKRNALRRATSRLRVVARSNGKLVEIESAIIDYFSDHQWEKGEYSEVDELLIAVEDARYAPNGTSQAESLAKRAAELMRRIESVRRDA